LDPIRFVSFELCKNDGHIIQHVIQDRSDARFLRLLIATDKRRLHLNVEGALRFQKRSTDYRKIIDLASGNQSPENGTLLYQAQEKALHLQRLQKTASDLSTFSNDNSNNNNNNSNSSSSRSNTSCLSVDISLLPETRLPTRSDMRLMASLERNDTATNDDMVELRQAEASMCTMSAHPTLPIYVAGSLDGHLGLWSFAERVEEGRLLKIYSASNYANNGKVGSGSGKGGKGGAGVGGGGGGGRGGGGGAAAAVQRVRFNATGDRFGAVDASGLLRLFSTSHLTSSTNIYSSLKITTATTSSVTQPYCTVRCNTRSQSDLLFLDTSTTVATSGLGSKLALCVWDTLMPAACSLVHVVSVPGSGGVTSLLSIPSKRTLVAGTVDGKVWSYDVRMLNRGSTEMFQGATHRGAITSLSYGGGRGGAGSVGCLASASKDGVVEVWSLPSGTAAKTKITKETLGIKGTGVKWWNDLSLLTWGVDGKVVLHTMLESSNTNE